MVDSGSDVVTVRESVLQQLHLELLGTIQSRGVHATKQKQLYRATLSVGDVQVEVEVRQFAQTIQTDFRSSEILKRRTEFQVHVFLHFDR